MSHRRLVIMSEIALTLALAYVLGLLKVWQMPQGGEVSLAMLPLLVLALRRGLPVGLVVGFLYGLLDLTYSPPYIVHWVQFFLDYPFAYMAVGLAGVFAPALKRALSRGSKGLAVWGAIIPGVALGALGRFTCHLVSGAVFFGEYAPKGQPVWLYSAGYNSFVFVSAVLCAAFAVIVLMVLQRVVPVEGK
ncbi:MAG: energy-coupled thiamine transporter ThiT [Actinobacteria bacterium HGW-Actinobacteria-6]|nr:MAG: energy-coupled thiamine transporter ThiT [Actinobacteria bacterium HGW-Actinobacteria-6]